MKKWNKVMAVILTVALLCGMSEIVVKAAETYTYTVTFYAGNQGVFSGSEHVLVSNKEATVTVGTEKIVVSGLNAGDKVGMNAQSAVKLGADSKYYVQGIRLSGRDNRTVSASVFEVDGDRDYVAAYGIKGNQVKYTVNYMDEEGKELVQSDIFYGNVGDKPVVAYKYIDGYSPKVLGLTKTLSANEAENVFTFVYAAIPDLIIDQQIREETVTQVVPGGVTVIGGGAGGNAGAGDGGNAGTQDSGASGNTEAGENAGNTEAGQTNEGTEAEDESDAEGIIVDLDDEEVPLADSEKSAGEVQLDVPMKTYAALIAVGVAALIVIIVLLVYLKKKRK